MIVPCDPFFQGARLTAYELVTEKIPGTLVCDSMVSFLMKEKGIDAVVVGADRVVANGDTANKVGTYQVSGVDKLDVCGLKSHLLSP